MKYIFVAYKPDSSDYCRGCRMASYSGSFLSRSNISQEELIEEWGKIQLANKNLDCNEEGFSVQIWEDGMLRWDDIYSSGPISEGIENEDECVAHADKMYELERAAYALGAKAKDEQDRKLREEAAELKRKQDEHAKEMRRKQLEALKKEFGE